ncbi:hypothetical protein pb186bvf_000305 [Paramecium bursaria]
MNFRILIQEQRSLTLKLIKLIIKILEKEKELSKEIHLSMRQLIDDYKLQLYSTNTSLAALTFIDQRIGGEVIMDIGCQLTKATVSIPVRHYKIANIKCIFDLESWLEYYQEAIDKTKQLDCPGCHAKTTFSDYGVDYSLLNVISIIDKFQLGQYIVKSKMGLTFGKNQQYKFFALAKPLRDNKKFDIPGTQAVMGINRNNQRQNNTLTQIQKVVQDESSFTIMKMQQYLQSKKQYRQLVRQRNVIEALAKTISQEYLKNTWLNKLGQRSFKYEIVFALKKVQGGNNFTTYLIIYFIHYAIWVDYELYEENQQNYVQKDNALYLKGSDSDQRAHYIYIIGGKTGPFQQSNKFQRITVPLNPFEQSRKLQVTNLKPLLKDGYNFMGGINEGKVFVFYGQRKFIDNNYVKEELLNSSWKYENGNWVDLKLQLLPRFDGSSFISHTTNQNIGKFIVFYGGLEKSTQGLAQPYCKQQIKAQIFMFETEKFLGTVDPTFQVNFDHPDQNQFKSLCSPILSVPYQPGVQLLLSGEYLKEGLVGKRLIFNFNYGVGVVKLNQVFSFEPPEYALTPYQLKQQGNEIFTPIHDSCGEILFGTYYSILSIEDSQDRFKGTITNLITINLTNGQVKLFDYQDSRLTQQRAQEFIKTLPNKETQKIILN